MALMHRVLAETAETLTPAEFERARALVKSGLLMSLEGTEGQAAYVARQLSLYGRLVEPAEMVAEIDAVSLRSEEHTSELQSLMRISYAVFCLTKKQHKN